MHATAHRKARVLDRRRRRSGGGRDRRRRQAHQAARQRGRALGRLGARARTCAPTQQQSSATVGSPRRARHWRRGRRAPGRQRARAAPSAAAATPAPAATARSRGPPPWPTGPLQRGRSAPTRFTHTPRHSTAVDSPRRANKGSSCDEAAVCGPTRREQNTNTNSNAPIREQHRCSAHRLRHQRRHAQPASEAVARRGAARHAPAAEPQTTPPRSLARVSATRAEATRKRSDAQTQRRVRTGCIAQREARLERNDARHQHASHARQC